MITYKPNLKQRARHLRKNMTESENALWSRLRGKQVLGGQFYRQKPIGGYIVDFIALRGKLVVEVDGSQHIEGNNIDGVVKSPVFVIARSSAIAGRRSNPVFSRTYKNEIASLSLAMTLLPTFYEIINIERDKRRDEYLSSVGLKVLRFNSRQVLEETDAVLQVIYQAIKERLNSEIPPSPPFDKGGLGGFKR